MVLFEKIKFQNDGGTDAIVSDPFLRKFSGQSLVELVLVMVVLLPLLVGLGYGGMAIYQGNMASEAIKEPTAQKSQLAGRSGAISNNELLEKARTGVTGNLMGNTSALDSIRLSEPIGDIVVMVGEKRSVTIPLLNITFDFAVSQPIQTNLLLANTGVRSSSPDGLSANLANRKGPPWENPLFVNENLPSVLECANPPVNIDARSVNALYPNAPAIVYHSRDTFNIQAALARDAVLQLTESPGVISKCKADAYAGICNTERENLMPKPAEKEEEGCIVNGEPTCLIKSFFKNPKGAPGQQLELIYNFKTEAEEKNFSVLHGPPHGLYFDPSEQYEQPPEDFVYTCTHRKEAECKMREAAKMANLLVSEYPDACQD